MKPCNKKSNQRSGFTLVELMMVIAVIGIITAISVPVYKNYTIRVSIQSCLSEVKGYSNDVFYTLNDQDDTTVTIAPTINACESITDATGWNIMTQQIIVALPKYSPNTHIKCDPLKGASCHVLQ